MKRQILMDILKIILLVVSYVVLHELGHFIVAVSLGYNASFIVSFDQLLYKFAIASVRVEPKAPFVWDGILIANGNLLGLLPIAIITMKKWFSLSYFILMLYLTTLEVLFLLGWIAILLSLPITFLTFIYFNKRK